MIPLLLSIVMGAMPTEAGQDECVACCRSAGLVGCRSTLRMFGEGSVANREAGAWRILGVWMLDCDGSGRFEPGSTAVVADLPVTGELLLAGSPPMALHCFSQACSFPQNACFHTGSDGRVRLVDCRDGASIPAAALKAGGPAAPGSEAVVVVVGGQPLVVTPVQGRPAPPRASSSSGSSCCGADVHAAATAADPRSAQVTRSGSSSGAASAPGAMVLQAEPSHAEIVLEVPEPPLSDECDTAEALRTESRRRVEAGDDALLAGELQRAIDEYRAALTLDLCNPYAWADLGSAALQVGQVEAAALALAQAVELQPRHYTAYTNLGLAYERLGRGDFAREAFLVALSLRPHHAAAQVGLRRVESGLAAP